MSAYPDRTATAVSSGHIFSSGRILKLDLNMPLHRAVEINYYEELGVERDASPENIRDSFRALVRILHPDHQTDQSLKAIAERQMQKLNRIYAVLSDPEQRSQYDQVLRGEDAPPTIIFSPAAGVSLRQVLGRFAWIGAVLVSVAFLFWLASDGTGGPQIPILERGGAAAPASAPILPPASGDPAEDIAHLRADLRIARAERDAAIRQLSKLQGKPDAPEPAASGGRLEQAAPARAPLTIVTELPSTTKLPPAASPQTGKPALPGVRQFTGFWFYNRPAHGQDNKNTSLYLPEFIEATITEQNGMIHGGYRSRYQIVDRAISPDVNFEFSGVPNGSTIACSWSGSAGARGELIVRITGENAMRIDWTTTELGSSQGLVSGTAILNRRVE